MEIWKKMWVGVFFWTQCSWSKWVNCSISRFYCWNVFESVLIVWGEMLFRSLDYLLYFLYCGRFTVFSVSLLAFRLQFSNKLEMRRERMRHWHKTMQRMTKLTDDEGYVDAGELPFCCGPGKVAVLSLHCTQKHKTLLRKQSTILQNV